ncbi:hypothetical protein ACU3L3_07260 [Priestia endophytica]
MIKVGDVLTAKQNFMIRNNIPLLDRKFTVSSVDRVDGNSFLGAIRSLDNQITIATTFHCSDFYFSENLNITIKDLLNREEIISFNAVTVDGKVINLDLIK